jgi:hypothetical protein
MTIAVGDATCAGPERHEWVLRSVDFEDTRSVSVFECLLCGRVDHRDGR